MSEEQWAERYRGRVHFVWQKRSEQRKRREKLGEGAGVGGREERRRVSRTESEGGIVSHWLAVWARVLVRRMWEQKRETEDVAFVSLSFFFFLFSWSATAEHHQRDHNLSEHLAGIVWRTQARELPGKTADDTNADWNEAMCGLYSKTERERERWGINGKWNGDDVCERVSKHGSQDRYCGSNWIRED